MSKKYHYYDHEETQKLPAYIREKHHVKLEYVAIDGYIRPRCTSIIPLVDCYYCKRVMKKKGIIT